MTDLKNKDIHPGDSLMFAYTWNILYNEWEKELNIAKLATYIIISLLFMVAMSSTVYMNTEYERSLITRFGEVNRVTDPGIHLKIPFAESRFTADTRMEQMDINEWIATKGGSNRVKVHLVINHKINPDPSNIIELYKLFGGTYNYEGRFLSRSAADKLKSSVSKREISDVTDNRDTIRNEVVVTIQKAAFEYGIEVKSVQIASIEFDPEYIKKLKGVQDARAKAAAAKEQEIQAKFLANKKIEQARGAAESVKLAASATAFKIKTESTEKANAIERIGMANAKAIKLQNEAAKNAAGLADLRRAEATKNWDGSVPQFMSGGSGSGVFPFMNVKDFTK